MTMLKFIFHNHNPRMLFVYLRILNLVEGDSFEQQNVTKILSVLSYT